MRLILLVLTLILMLSPGPALSQEPVYDLAISRARVVDGTGGKAFYANVGILDGTIRRVERDTSRQLSAKKQIDGSGKILTPGFIDTHAHGNPLETPAFRNFLAMGVTTIFLGQDGSSPQVEDLSEWMKQVEAKNPGVNIGLFAGHNTLRFLSETGYDSLPREADLHKMERLLQQAMDAGSFGMSLGLEYNPGYLAKKEELRRLARVVGQNNGIISSHMRSEDDATVEASIKELLALGEYCPVHISHLKVVYGKGEARAREVLQLIDSARAGGKWVSADIYPYNASYTGIGILFPDWAKAPNDYQEVIATRGKELRKYLRELVNKRNGPEATLIGSGRYAGKTLAEVSTALNMPFEVILMNNIGPTGVGAAYFVMDGELQKTLLTHPVVNICSDGSPGMRHPRGYGSFAKIIETYVLKEELLSLEEAVHKMTGRAAMNIGLQDRGTLGEGCRADLLLFDPSMIRANATYEQPHQLATGMEYVIINGKIAKEGEVFSRKGNGELLKKNAANQ